MKFRVCTFVVQITLSMTETELTDRLREAIVLDGPDAWRTNGYLQDAQNAGLSLPVALKRAAEIGQEVNNNSILYQNIRARIARLAQPSRAHLFEQDINQIINAARSLNLSPDFVRNRWIPAELAKVAPKPAPPAPEPAKPSVTATPDVQSDSADAYEDLLEPEPVSPPSPVRGADPAPVIEITPVAEPIKPTPPPPAPEPVYPPVNLPEPPAPVVRMFTATPARIHQGQAVTLEWDVSNLLAVTIDDLGEGLSPKNRGWVKPKKTTDYTLFDANNTPLSTVRVEVIPRDRSGIYGVVFALVLLAIIYWFIRNTNSGSRSPEPTRQERTRSTASETSALSRQAPEPVPTETEPTAEAPVEPTPDETESVATDSKPTTEVLTTKPEPEPNQVNKAEPAPQPASPADARQGKYEEAFGDKPYDKVELGTDERGWRRARSQGRWGYVNQSDEWVIEPEYDAVTPFRGDVATAFLNGQLIKINREGEPVSN